MKHRHVLPLALAVAMATAGSTPSWAVIDNGGGPPSPACKIASSTAMTGAMRTTSTPEAEPMCQSVLCLLVQRRQSLDCPQSGPEQEQSGRSAAADPVPQPNQRADRKGPADPGGADESARRRADSRAPWRRRPPSLSQSARGPRQRSPEAVYYCFGECDGLDRRWDHARRHLVRGRGCRKRRLGNRRQGAAHRRRARPGARKAA